MLFFGGFFLIATIIPQVMGFQGSDISWLQYAAERVLNGEVLNVEVIESNPPLIVYLNMIPVFIGKILGVSAQICFVAFVALLTLISLWACFKITQENWLRLALIFALTFYAGVNFGQREHFMLIFALPYLLLLGEGREGHKNLTIFAALFASFGLALKPFYLLIWAMAAIFYAIYKRDITKLFIRENFIIGIMLLLYILYLLLIERNYAFEVFPWVLEFYGGFKYNFWKVFLYIYGSVILAQVSFWMIFFFCRKCLNRRIWLFWVCNTAALITVQAQQMGWPNHFYPAHAFAILLNISLIFALFENLKARYSKLIIFLASFILTIFLALGFVANITIGFGLNAEKLKEQIAIINQYAKGGNVATLSFDLASAFPAIYYSEADYKSRYAHLWMLPGIYQNAKPDENDKIAYHPSGARSDWEIRMIARVVGDIAHNPPHLIIVPERKYNTDAIGDFYFDFVEYFSTSEDFRNIWENYKEVARIDEHVFYAYKPATIDKETERE